ncbi:tectonic-3 [Pleurodeles waltl]|uniref:tectonic-3 n=1 Tax=Pleurodeles waltl TaxID=8319 RepID=UPI003709BC61
MELLWVLLALWTLALLPVMHCAGPATTGYKVAPGVTTSAGTHPTTGNQGLPGVVSTAELAVWKLDPADQASRARAEDVEGTGNWILGDIEDFVQATESPTTEKPNTYSVARDEEAGRTSHPKGRGAAAHARSQGRARATSVTILLHCTCDLSPGTCDINCCCDPDCNLSDPLVVFTYCLLGSTESVSQRCVDSTLIFRHNTPLTNTNNDTATPNQFCIQVNDSSLNFFSNQQNVTESDFPGIVAQYGGPSFIQSNEPDPSNPSFYKVGDPILTLSNSSTLGVLRQLVAQGPGGRCADTNPAGFLEAHNSSCVRTFTNLNHSCTRDPLLGADWYYRFFSVLKVPNTVNGSVSQQVPVTPASTPKGPFLLGSSCINIVSEVSYVIDYIGTEGIHNVSVFFTLTNLSGDLGSSFLHRFSVFFQSSLQIVQGTVQRSGNPGYIVGAALLTSVGGTRIPVTIMQSQNDGTCSTHSRSIALFGLNMRTGCRLSEAASNSCTGFSEELMKILLGTQPPQNLATFGNANPSNSTEWSTQIIYQNCRQTQGDCSTGCIVPVSLEIQVLWAEVGLRSNPQAQVLGARFKSHCSLLMCRSPIFLETIISFIDTTLYPQHPRGQPATFWKLPFDFFPFKVAVSGVAVLGRNVPCTFLFSFAAVIFHLIIAV